MFFKIEGINLNHALGLDRNIKINGFDYDNIISIQRKNKDTVFLVRINNRESISSVILSKGMEYSDAELENIMKSYEEKTYYVYDNVAYAADLAERGFPVVEKEDSEQDRYKNLCERGYWGIKFRTNIENIRRW